MDLTQDSPCIVGTSYRLPGKVHDINSLWNALNEGNWESCSTLPPDSRGLSDFGQANPTSPVGRGGWLGEEGIETFDASFFGISDEEAKTLRPNIRLALELTYEALENSGIPPSSLRGKSVSVSIGAGTEDGWDMRRWREDGLDAFDQQWAASSDPSGIPGYISHCFDFKGSCNTISGACASGAFALRDGINSLLYEKAEVAIVGALTTHFSPAPFQWAMATGVASRKGRSSAFSPDADGYSPSEGAVFFVLKRYAAARSAGDAVRGIIRGLACGHNGKMRSLVTPNTAAQVELARKVLKAANVQAKDVQLLEAHGTGTPVGDALEAEGIRVVFGEERSDKNPLMLSSAKTVFGHCHGAAALVGILKVLACFEHLVVPPHHVKPNAEFSKGTIILPTEPTPLNHEKLFAQVNSFGFTGGIASIILERDLSLVTSGFQPSSRPPFKSLDNEIYFLPFSAKSPAALATRIRSVSEWMLTSKCSLSEVACVLAITREHHPFRRAFITANVQEFLLQAGNRNSDHKRQLLTLPSQHLSREMLNTSNISRDIFDEQFSLEDFSNLIAGNQILHAAKHLYERGHDLDFSAIYSKKDIDPETLKTFPHYPFERKRYWKSPPRNIHEDGSYFQTPSAVCHPLSTHLLETVPLSSEQSKKAFPVSQYDFEELIDTFAAPFSLPPSSKAVRRPHSHILFTGGNGMLGSQTILRLLENGNITVYAVVRSGDPIERMRTAFRKYDLPLSTLESAYSDGTLLLFRSEDICAPKLGLSDEDYSILQEHLDSIVHAAWPVNFNLPLGEFKPLISCSRNLVELAVSAKKYVEYHFIGSYASTFNYGGELVPEHALPPRVEDSLAQGYAIAKLITENSLLRIHAAHRTSFDLTIIRVGQVCGDSKNGSWNQDEMIPMMIASLPAIRALPRDFPNVSWIPSDVCADALRDIILCSPDKSGSRIMHVSNPTITPWSEIVKDIGNIAGLGSPELISFEQYVHRVREKTRNSPTPLPIARLLPYFIKSLEEGSMPERYASLHVQETLRYSPALRLCPPISGALLENIVHKLISPTTHVNSSALIYLFGPWSVSLSEEENKASKTLQDKYLTLANELRAELGDDLDIVDHSLKQQLRTLSHQLTVVEELKKREITPRAVLGYCFGEYAAAITAGILSEKIVIDILVRRSLALRGVEGAMLNVFANVPFIRKVLSRIPSGPSLAINAGPTHSILSGSKSQIKAAEIEFGREGIKTLIVHDTLPFHSPQMDTVVPKISKCSYVAQGSEIKFISGITASTIPSPSLGFKYWLRHMRDPINFYGALQHVRTKFVGCSIIDIGPGESLSKMISRYGWNDVVTITSKQSSQLSASIIHKAQTRLYPHPSQTIPTPALTPGPLPTPTLGSDSGISLIPTEIALNLLRDLFGYNSSPEILSRSLHSVGLQSMDFIRFADHFASRTGIHISLSAYASDLPLEAIIRNGRTSS